MTDEYSDTIPPLDIPKAGCPVTRTRRKVEGVGMELDTLDDELRQRHPRVNGRGETHINVAEMASVYPQTTGSICRP